MTVVLTYWSLKTFLKRCIQFSAKWNESYESKTKNFYSRWHPIEASCNSGKCQTRSSNLRWHFSQPSYTSSSFFIQSRVLTVPSLRSTNRHQRIFFLTNDLRCITTYKPRTLSRPRRKIQRALKESHSTLQVFFFTSCNSSLASRWTWFQWLCVKCAVCVSEFNACSLRHFWGHSLPIVSKLISKVGARQVRVFFLVKCRKSLQEQHCGILWIRRELTESTALNLIYNVLLCEWN